MKASPIEKTPKRRTIRLLTILLVLLALAGGLALIFRHPLNQFRSAMSIRKVNDGRLLVMHYYGDYGFDDYLEGGMAWRTNIGPISSTSRVDWACTGFAALGSDSAPLFGRNYDYTQVKPLILYTDPPDGFASISMVDTTFLGALPEDLSWQNRLRLLQAPYYPFDGMNEYGLAVGMMAIPLADGGHDPQKVTIGSLPVIRLVLDHARNVAEAIALLPDYNVDFSGGPAIHYLMADASGHSVVVEYLQGKPEVIHNNSPWQVATNFVLSGRSLQIAKSTCPRYRTAYEALRQAGGLLTPAQSMSLLRNVSQRSTSWSIVYGLTSGEIELVLDQDYKHVLDFDLEMVGDR